MSEFPVSFCVSGKHFEQSVTELYRASNLLSKQRRQVTKREQKTTLQMLYLKRSADSLKEMSATTDSIQNGKVTTEAG